MLQAVGMLNNSWDFFQSIPSLLSFYFQQKDENFLTDSSESSHIKVISMTEIFAGLTHV